MKCTKCDIEMNKASLSEFICPQCGHIEFYAEKQEKAVENTNQLIYKILGQAISMLCSASAVILTICGGILGVIVTRTGHIEGLPILLYSIIALIISFIAGLYAHFTLVSVIHGQISIYHRALKIPVIIQQIFMLIGLIFIAYFAYILISN